MQHILVIPIVILTLLTLLITMILEVEDEAVEKAEAKFNAKCVLRMVILQLCVITGSMLIMYQDLHRILLGLQDKAILTPLSLLLSSGILILHNHIHSTEMSHLLGCNKLSIIQLGNLLCLHSSGIHHQLHTLGHNLSGPHLNNPGLQISGMHLHCLQGLHLVQVPSNLLSLVLLRFI